MNQLTPCSACGAKLQLKTMSYPQTMGDKVAIVEDVPAWVCMQCGETYLSPPTVDAIYRSVPALAHPLTDQDMTAIAAEEHARHVAQEGTDRFTQIERHEPEPPS